MTLSQYGQLIHVKHDGDTKTVERVSFNQTDLVKHYDEKWLQDKIFTNPGALPLKQLDPSFGPLIPVCRELNTGAGPIDILFVNKDGMLTLVECKLWRNPEARRKVVGQILDYAKELSQWDYEDIQREVSRSLNEKGNHLFRLVSGFHKEVGEADFVDNVAKNLKEGKFLLIILGDGITQGVEAITEFIQGHAGLHFTFGLVEAAIYEMHDGYLIQPRVLAKTFTINRYVISVDAPDGQNVQLNELDGPQADMPVSSGDPSENRKESLQVWQRFLPQLHLDDSSQQLPNPRLNAYLIFNICSLPKEVWLLIYRDKQNATTAVVVNFKTNSTLARQIYDTLLKEREIIDPEIGYPVEWKENPGESEGPHISVTKQFEKPLAEAEVDEQIAWLSDYTNTFVNAFRHRIEQIIRELNI